MKSAALEYGVGDRVRHLKYGDGTVTEIVDDPRDYKVTIQFDGAGQKIMYAAFAKLKKTINFPDSYSKSKKRVV